MANASHDLEPCLDWEGYLAHEQSSLLRHEFLNGVIHAMAGGTQAHNTIVLNLAAELRTHLRGGPCRVYSETMNLRILTPSVEFGTYPDVMVSCDPSEASHPLHIAHPKTLIEVLSKNTSRTDRSEKVPNFKYLPALQEILLVDSRTRLIERYQRKTDWELERLDHLEIPSLSFSLDADVVYESSGL